MNKENPMNHYNRKLDVTVEGRGSLIDVIKLLTKIAAGGGDNGRDALKKKATRSCTGAHRRTRTAST